MHRAFRPAVRRGAAHRPPPAGPPAGLPVAAVGLVLAVGLGGCGLLPGGRADPAAPTRAPLEGGAGPGPAGLTPAAYEVAVTPVAEDLRASLDALGAARGHAGLLDRAQAAEAAVTGAAGRLAALTPPEALVDEHTELIASLDDLSLELSATAEAVERLELCAAPAVLARVTGSEAAARVRAAGAALDGAAPGGLATGKLLPARVTSTSRRLPDGTILIDRRRGGLGELRVDNRGTRQDSVVSLVRGRRVMVAVYVARGARHTLGRISDGTYRVLQTAGVDYDRRRAAFTRECSFSRFDDPLRFTTTPGSSTAWTVSFRPVTGGNAKISDIDPDDFPTS